MYCQVCGAAQPGRPGVLRPLPSEAAGALGRRRARTSRLRGRVAGGELLLRRAPPRADLDPRGGGQAHRRDRAPAPRRAHKQEKNLLINQTGLPTLRELLEPRSTHRPRGVERPLGVQDGLPAAGAREARALPGDQGSDRRAPPGRQAQGRSSSTWRTPSTPSSPSTSSAPCGALESAYQARPGQLRARATSSARRTSTRARPSQALPVFQRVLEVKPDHYEGLVYSGVIHHERGDHDRAEEYLKRAVALYPGLLPAALQPRRGLRRPGEPGARRGAILEQAVQIDRGAAGPLPARQLPTTRWASRAGVHTCRRRCATIPAFEEAHHLLGLAYLDRHWHKKALDSFRQAQRLNPKKLQYQDLVRYLSGAAGYAAARSARRGRATCCAAAEELTRARQSEARPRRATGARCRSSRTIRRC